MWGSVTLDVIKDSADQIWIGDIRNCPPQSALRRISISKIRCNRWAQVSGPVVGSLQSLRDSLGKHGRVVHAATDSLKSPERADRVIGVLSELRPHVSFMVHIITLPGTEEQQWMT